MCHEGTAGEEVWVGASLLYQTGNYPEAGLMEVNEKGGMRKDFLQRREKTDHCRAAA